LTETQTTSKSKTESKKDLTDDQLFELVGNFPNVFQFMPTSAIMQKLIVRATQLKTKADITYALNPKEKKRLLEESNF
jgi:hypothetical protein